MLLKMPQNKNQNYDFNIFVLPSFTEGHLWLIEALARRRPVVIFE